jgi:hypothetical protein
MGEVRDLAFATLRAHELTPTNRDLVFAEIPVAEMAMGFHPGTIAQLLGLPVAQTDELDLEEDEATDAPTVEITQRLTYRRTDYSFGATPPEFPPASA